MTANRTIMPGVCGMSALLLAALIAVDAPTKRATACGGFFCQARPIIQASEQIIFRQDGNRITAIVQIQYQGTAEDFSWVVPVPGIPNLSVAPGILFQTLDPLTRPRFTLEINGQACPDDRFFTASPEASAGPSTDAGVTILSEQSVGPFDVQIVTSEDAGAMADWLEANNYDLTDRGGELIAPYVEEGMNFVALRLRQDRGVGDIEPLVMEYEAECPMIPIRLTAVATQPNLGVFVWLLGPARAVPTNYLHVTPNYARLDWYNGPFGAYASYQNLITVAMDEVGGQGFATDYAGRDASLLEPLLTQPQRLREEAIRLRALGQPATALAQLINLRVFPGAKVLEIDRRRLPLPTGAPESTYGDATALASVFDGNALATALSDTLDELESDLVQPLQDALAVFDGDPYLTRMFTTLSADEMTLDPQFGFNSDLPPQPLERKATLDINCVLGQTDWTLTLGEGTGRAGEVLMTGSGPLPLTVPEPLAAQSPVKQAVRLSADTATQTGGEPEVVVDNQFTPITTPPTFSFPTCDLGLLPLLAISGLMLSGLRCRRIGPDRR